MTRVWPPGLTCGAGLTGEKTRQTKEKEYLPEDPFSRRYHRTVPENRYVTHPF